MGVERSKFRATPRQAQKELEKELGQRRGFSNSYERSGFHSIDDGDNKFRIYPANPDSENLNFCLPKSVVFLSVELDKYDEDGEKTGEKEIRRKPIFTSDIHGPIEMKGKDLVKEYIKFAKEKFKEMFETKEEQEACESVLNNFKTGIRPNLKWVMYADKYKGDEKEFGILEISNAQKKELNKLASDMDTGDDPLMVDPFTDPDDGIPIIINKTGKGLDTEYAISFEEIRKGKNIILTDCPLTDEDLEHFLKFESLEKKFVNSFTKKDFEYQKEGLMHFDQESEFNFFDDEEFIEILEHYQELVDSHIPEKGEKPEKKEDEMPFEPDTHHKREAAKKVSGSISIKKKRKVKETPEPEPEEEEDEYDEQEQEQEEKPVNSTEDRLKKIKERLAKK